ncbi:MAG TPA: S-methyl-5'-thioinosine phosphorylase [Pseudomonadales bacterium]|jgi:purine nucleoside phosphorylase
MRRLAVLVGSGALKLPFDVLVEDFRDTPYGEASSKPSRAAGRNFIVHVLARHGVPHAVAPHLINYRANLHLLSELGVEEIVALNTVGGIAKHARNGRIVLPDQIIDYTWGRAHSFAAEGDLKHVDFTEPYDAALRAELLAAARGQGLDVHDGGVYGCTQGPRFESPAEIDRMDRDGCTVVGMTGMPEAGLARELGIRYASLCLVVNPAAGRGDAIDLDHIAVIAREGMEDVARLLGGFFQGIERGD